MKNLSITGSTLKMSAILIMLIDHIGAAIIGPLRNSLSETQPDIANILRVVYFYMRSIGRLAFPIFCFLLVEGFLHTRNAGKYAKRLFLFALISEIPFDFALAKSLFDHSHNNIYFTLLIGLLVMMGVSYFERKTPCHPAERYFHLFMQMLIAAAGLFTAKYLHTDYGFMGVFLIEVLYFLRMDRRIQVIFGAIAISWEAAAPLAFLPIWFYNGERGRQWKYFFYWFYPVHLVILGFLKMWLFY